MKLILFFASFLFLCSCTSKTYVIDRTSAVPEVHYARSFAIVQDENFTEPERKLEHLVRKHLLKAKWRYDTEKPDYLLTVSFKNDEVYMNLLDAQTYNCHWQGRVTTLKKTSEDTYFDRALWAVLR